MPDQIQSPETLPDRRVTFRIYAPKATEVILDGDWVLQGLGTGGPFQKDDQGVWSITVGPLPPDFYMYTLAVDGVPTIDPQNRAVKQGIAPLKNVLLVPGEEAAFEVTAAVPQIPEALINQLKEDGLIVAPVGAGGAQRLVVCRKNQAELDERFICDVRFVRLIGENAFKQ